ncbi:MAG: heme-copper oxidase subunit III [bacterium]
MTTKTIAHRLKENGDSRALVFESPVNRGLLGLLAFIGTEVMFFGGLISAFIILRAGTLTWPPIDQPRLPVAVTGINTFILLFSGFTMAQAIRSIRAQNSNLTRWLLATAALGAIFLVVQGSEWLRLVGYGLTFTSSIYGGTFYTLIGFHALHVVGAMIALLFVLRKSFLQKYTPADHDGVILCGAYWYFVVAIWPMLYILVYLN